jgi:hypothetical protein
MRRVTIRDTAVQLWRRGQHGWPARYPIAQFPNAALLVYLAAVVASAGVVATVALSIWALDEIVRGANLFRRGLGTVVLVWTVVGLTR